VIRKNKTPLLSLNCFKHRGKDQIGIAAKAYINKGELAPNEVTRGIIKN
jgi:hypothetical protein